MTTRKITLMSLCLLGSVLAACGDDGAVSTEAGDETGETGESGDGDGDDDPTTGDGDGDPTTGDGDGDPTTGDGDGEIEDTEPPIVVSIEPADGALGVLPDAVITIVFSEPMDKVATQSAYQSADLGAGVVTMGWNAEGDTLTITPNDPLEVAEGVDIDAFSPITYEISITEVARDLAGNELDAAATSQFSVARRITGALEPVVSLIGSVLQDGTEVPGWLVVGDTEEPVANAELRVVLSFDLTNVSTDILVWESATLTVEQNYVAQTPFEDLGAVEIEHISYASFSEAFTAEGTELGMFSESPEVGMRSFDVTEALTADFAAANPMTQFRLSCVEPTDWDGQADAVWFDPQTLWLSGSVLIP